MMLAVLSTHVIRSPMINDLYVSTVGGARAVEPGVDLAVALATYSSVQRTPITSGTVVVGEVGLTGELRPTVGVARRLAEAARLGFTRAVVPAAGEAVGDIEGMRIIPVTNVGQAAMACGLFDVV
jgi:DNA repair protein RadA/Sms